MIPYEELVHALEDWRARQGLGAPSTRAARQSAPVAAQPAPYVPPPPQPNRGTGSYAAAPAAVAQSARPVLDDYEGEAGTEIRSGLEDEIDVDAEAVDVIDEQIEDE
jgi:hypothetical protein